MVKSSTLIKSIIDVITGPQRGALKTLASNTLSNLMESGDNDLRKMVTKLGVFEPMVEQLKYLIFMF